MALLFYFYTPPQDSGWKLWFHVGCLCGVPVCPSVVCTSVHTSVFRFWMITWVNINGFSPNLVCALILWRSGLGLLLGKFRQIFTELSARDMIMEGYYSLTFLFAVLFRHFSVSNQGRQHFSLDGKLEKDSIPDSQWGQENANPQVHCPSGKLGRPRFSPDRWTLRLFLILLNMNDDSIYHSSR